MGIEINRRKVSKLLSSSFKTACAAGVLFVLGSSLKSCMSEEVASSKVKEAVSTAAAQLEKETNQVRIVERDIVAVEQEGFTNNYNLATGMLLVSGGGGLAAIPFSKLDDPAQVEQARSTGCTKAAHILKELKDVTTKGADSDANTLYLQTTENAQAYAKAHCQLKQG